MLFPKVKWVESASPKEQLTKLEEEFKEVVDAFNEWTLDSTDFKYCTLSLARENLLIELVDVIHSCETFMRMLNVNEEEWSDLIGSVKSKNEIRGYYTD